MDSFSVVVTVAAVLLISIVAATAVKIRDSMWINDCNVVGLHIVAENKVYECRLKAKS